MYTALEGDVLDSSVRFLPSLSNQRSNPLMGASLCWNSNRWHRQPCVLHCLTPGTCKHGPVWWGFPTYLIAFFCRGKQMPCGEQPRLGVWFHFKWGKVLKGEKNNNWFLLCFHFPLRFTRSCTTIWYLPDESPALKAIDNTDLRHASLESLHFCLQIWLKCLHRLWWFIPDKINPLVGQVGSKTLEHNTLSQKHLHYWLS